MSRLALMLAFCVSAEASCITEMALLMACWKQNNFVDSLCFSEMKSFYTCVDQVTLTLTLALGL